MKKIEDKNKTRSSGTDGRQTSIFDRPSSLAPFDLLHHPLAGTTLIEANAGTGKTYTITGLFLRLILEHGLAVDEILVVTFTEAATAELKDRIRRKLREALDFLVCGRTPDPFIADLAAKVPEPEQAAARLRDALYGFDRAAVFTIHGFCRRVLHEQAFESGALFDTELVVDQEEIKREVVHDFWRRHFYQASPLFIHYLIHRKIKPDTLVTLAGERLLQPFLKVIPELSNLDTAPLEKAFNAALAQVRESWQADWDRITILLLQSAVLSKTQYRPDMIHLWIQSMHEYLSMDHPDPFLCKGFSKWTRTSLVQGTKKSHATPLHPFFDLCEMLLKNQEELILAFDRRWLGLQYSLLQELGPELTRRKQEKNLQSFDDLLQKVRQALQGRAAEPMGRALRGRFKAALIDEFQDTDPVQYEIFRRIFNSQDMPLFLIGDPKQAIYGFRGADLFTYLSAARDIQSRYTLQKNWRSQPGLIRAINVLFRETENPFVYEAIQYQPSVSALEKEAAPSQATRSNEAAMQIWFMDSRKFLDQAKAIPKGRAGKWINRSVAAEISRLLYEPADLKSQNSGKPFSPDEIAVLVRRNLEARRVQEALRDLGIPSVLYSSGNLFESPEARETERVLAAVVEPDQAKLLKAALATDMLGMSGEEIETLSLREDPWEEQVLRFKAYHELWDRQGFIRMFYAMLFENQVLSRAVRFDNGERRVTNLLHLAEVLHQALTSRKLNMTGLLKWLAEQRSPLFTGSEQQPLRLESDDRSVKLVTVHKSKGLEYPVVFCPFLWDGSRIKDRNEPLIFHDPRRQEMVLDLGSEDREQNREWAEQEILAENIRLFYVALTRARTRCYLVWGRLKEAETSAPAYLLYGPGSPARNSLVDRLAENVSRLDDQTLLLELQKRVEQSNGDLSVAVLSAEKGRKLMPVKGQKVDLQSRTFRGAIETQWRIASFSGLTASSSLRFEQPDHDAQDSFAEEAPMESKEPAPIQPESLFAFPRGARSGECLHKIFERLDFMEPDPRAVHELTAGLLLAYGFESKWEPAIEEMVQKVLHLNLGGPGESLELRRIARQERISELEFYFPLRPITKDTLTALFSRHAGPETRSGWPQQIGRLQFAPLKGYLKGFIDLVFRFQGRFYLVDWKSNRLGDRVEDYHPAAVQAAMTEHYYFLQYHFYVLALHQYLQQRLPGYDYAKHFGGVYYLFVRGMDPDQGREYGVFYDRPKPELVEDLSRELIDKKQLFKKPEDRIQETE